MQHLDAVFAFGVFILGVSLIITAGTQAVVSVLGLRGSNLRRSLADLFETACVDSDAKRYAKEIARRVLCHPLISDSVFSRFRIPIEKLPFVPPDAAGKLQGAGIGIPFRPWLLGAAGGFFACPIALAISRLVLPGACSYFDLVAHVVPLINICQHPWRTGAIIGAIFGGLLSRWRLATYIGFEELVATLEKLSEPLHGTLPTRVQCAMLVVAGEVQSEPFLKVKPVAMQVERLVEDAHAEGGGVAVAMEKAVGRALEPRLEGLKSWFDHAMDRASQRFTLQARMITVLLAFLLVFAAHLDAIHLFQTFSTDAQLRAQLALAANEITKEADVLRTKEGAALVASKEGRSGVPDVYRKAMTFVLAGMTTPETPAKKEEAKPTTRSKHKTSQKSETPTLRSPSVGDGQLDNVEIRAAKALGTMPGFASREEAISWLRSNLNGDPAADFIVTAYQRELDAELGDSDKLIDHSASLKSELARSEFHIIPETWPGWMPTSGELPGLLVAVALLTLCAPVWYTLLRNLARLRPAFASKQ